MKDFEWDSKKRAINLEKHGIDFVDVVTLFDEQDRIEAESVRCGEKRYTTLGWVNDVVLCVVYTWRHPKRRIISARRASKNERKAYEKDS